MNTVSQELNTILQVQVKTNYTNQNVDNYYTPSDMQPVDVATNPDRLLEFIVESILLTHNPALFGYGKVLTGGGSGTQKELYADILNTLAAGITDLTAVKAAIQTVHDAIV